MKAGHYFNAELEGCCVMKLKVSSNKISYIRIVDDFMIQFAYMIANIKLTDSRLKKVILPQCPANHQAQG